MSRKQMANDEIRMTNEVRNPNSEAPQHGCALSSFELRHSSFCRHSGFVIPLLVCASVSLWFNSASAAPSIDRIEIGFDGYYKLGYWTPLSIHISGLSNRTDCSLQVIVPDSDGVPTRVRQPISVAGAPTQRLYVKIGRNSGQMTVVVRQGEQEVARRAWDLGGGSLTPAMPSDSWLLLTLGTTKHLSQTLAAHKQLKRGGGRVITITNSEQLPDQWYGFDGVDLVVLPGGAPELPSLLADPPAVEALDAWLRRGGTLLLNPGSQARQLLTATGPVAQWSPGRFESLGELTTAGALERASGVESLLEPLTRGERFSLPLVRLAQPIGNILLATGPRRADLPLVIERPYGFGRVLFVALDLDEPLLARWPGTAPLVGGWFLPPQRSRDEEASDQLGEVAHAGYDDLAGQLRSALDQFQSQGVRLLPFGALLGLMLVYIVLLGPGDYLLVRRLLKRMEWTWITMPLLVVLSCAGAYALAIGLKGREARMNQVDVIDFDDVQQARRASTFFTLFSPRGQAYNLSLRPARPERESRDEGTNEVPDSQPEGHRPPVLLSWFGLPGTALGGMESRAAPPLAGRPYDFAENLSELAEVPVPIWSTKSFVARFSPPGEAPLTAELAPAPGALEGLLKGSVTNRLGKPLEECLLLTRRWAYPLGTLAAGERLAIHDGLGPRTTESFLTRRREADDAYDPQGSDVKRIVEMLSFYKAAKGTNYVGLKHRYETLLDMSLHLGTDRAVLVGVSRKPTAEVLDGDQPLAPGTTEGLTLYRVIVPIRTPQLPADR